MRRIMIALSIVGALAVGTTVYATQNLDWADEFISATINCLSRFGSQDVECTYDHEWDGGTNQPVRWNYVGAQHANVGGRAQAVEEVYTSWHEASDSCSGMTVNLSRRRIAAIPSENNSCTDGSSTFVGSVSYTKNSCVFAGADWDLSHRILPAYDFHQETASATTDIGYRSILAVSCTEPGCTSRTLTGCFKIHWF